MFVNELIALWRVRDDLLVRCTVGGHAVVIPDGYVIDPTVKMYPFDPKAAKGFYHAGQPDVPLEWPFRWFPMACSCGHHEYWVAIDKVSPFTTSARVSEARARIIERGIV